MSLLEKVDGHTWRDFLAAPASVLVLGKTTCAACRTYTEELEGFLASEGTRWPGVRFGKMLLDEGGLSDFKRASPWLAQVDALPFTQIYRAGERWKDFAGGNVERLRSRLERLSTAS